MKPRLVLSILVLSACLLHAMDIPVAGWNAYIARFESALGDPTQLRATPEERAKMSGGGVYIRQVVTPGQKLDGGLIHHWIGGILIPGAKIKPLQDWMKDYDAHSKYFAEIERSKLLSHDGDVYKIYYRFKRKKIITVYYNTEHTVTYDPVDGVHAASKSVATRIAELDNAGSKNEREKPNNDDSGYFWRSNSYWRFFETPQGVYVEFESISLSRAIPAGFGWMLKSFAETVPRESLENSLTSIRRGFKPAD